MNKNLHDRPTNTDKETSPKRMKTSDTYFSNDMDVGLQRPTCAKKPTPDKILTEMIESGRYTQDQVIQYCIESGVPLSRMFRLDLMRANMGSKKS